MAFKLPKNVVSKNNMKNVLYLVSLALAVGYVMNRQNIALVSLLVVAGAVYMLKKDVVLALGVSIVITNVLLAMNYFKRFEGFKEGTKQKVASKVASKGVTVDANLLAQMNNRMGNLDSSTSSNPTVKQ